MWYDGFNYIFLTIYEVFTYLDNSPFIPIRVALDIIDWCQEDRYDDDFQIWASPFEHYWIDMSIEVF